VGGGHRGAGLARATVRLQPAASVGEAPAGRSAVRRRLAAVGPAEFFEIAIFRCQRKTHGAAATLFAGYAELTAARIRSISGS
jgi:hypothetical protein